MGLLVEGDLLNPGAHVRHPGRIDNRKGLDADTRRWQRELDRMRRHPERVRGAFFHPRPHLVPGTPQHLEPAAHQLHVN